MNKNDHSLPSTNANSLRSVAPFAKIYVLKCQKESCHSGTKIKWNYDEKLTWLLRLECTNCNDEWAVCSSCINSHVAMQSKRQISMHKNTYHNKKNDHIPKRQPKRKHMNEKIEEFLLKSNQKNKTSFDNSDEYNHTERQIEDLSFSSKECEDTNVLEKYDRSNFINNNNDNNHVLFDNDNVNGGKTTIYYL